MMLFMQVLRQMVDSSVLNLEHTPQNVENILRQREKNHMWFFPLLHITECCYLINGSQR